MLHQFYEPNTEQSNYLKQQLLYMLIFQLHKFDFIIQEYKVNGRSMITVNYSFIFM